MKIMPILIAITLLLGCEKVNSPNENEKLKIASQIRKKVAQTLHRDFNLIPFGTQGQMMNQINLLGLICFYQNHLEIEKARELLISSVDIFINEINGNEKIRAYLVKFPFEPNNINIEIYIKKPDGSNFGKGELVIASATKGLLQYQIRDETTGHLKVVHQETYEQAVKQLQLSKAEPALLIGA